MASLILTGNEKLEDFIVGGCDCKKQGGVIKVNDITRIIKVEGHEVEVLKGPFKELLEE